MHSFGIWISLSWNIMYNTNLNCRVLGDIQVMTSSRLLNINNSCMTDRAKSNGPSVSICTTTVALRLTTLARLFSCEGVVYASLMEVVSERWILENYSFRTRHLQVTHMSHIPSFSISTISTRWGSSTSFFRLKLSSDWLPWPHYWHCLAVSNSGPLVSCGLLSSIKMENSMQQQRLLNTSVWYMVGQTCLTRNRRRSFDVTKCFSS